jgi:cation diffusion facilitator CzcD-associated flavoprotein CzcO
MAIIIIGAGLAGLAAANHLRDRGIPSIILEARNRAGGRVWIDNSLRAPLLFTGRGNLESFGSPQPSASRPRDDVLTECLQRY